MLEENQSRKNKSTTPKNVETFLTSIHITFFYHCYYSTIIYAMIMLLEEDVGFSHYFPQVCRFKIWKKNAWIAPIFSHLTSPFCFLFAFQHLIRFSSMVCFFFPCSRMITYLGFGDLFPSLNTFYHRKIFFFSCVYVRGYAWSISTTKQYLYIRLFNYSLGRLQTTIYLSAKKI